MATICNLDIGSTSLTSLGVVTTGTWNATTPIGLLYGGTNANLTAANGGILYSGASALAIKAATATANQGLFSASSTAPVWSTTTWPTTITTGNLLETYITTSAVVQVTSAAGGVVGRPSSLHITVTALTNGQLYAYTTGGTNAIQAKTPTAGYGIGVTLGAGSIALQSPVIVDQNSSSVTFATNTITQYLVDNGASLVTFTLPTSPATGVDIYIVTGGSSGGWKIAQAASQFIQLPGGVVTTTGTGGSISSNSRYDSIIIAASPTAHQFTVIGVTGNPSYV